jgi:gas vesicle protein
MSYGNHEKDSHPMDLPFGLIFGLLLGALVGILFAPKPGKELQKDVQDMVNQLPDGLNNGLSKSKERYQELVGKTKQNIETQLEKRNKRKVATRMAEAKRREEEEIGSLDY